MFEAFHQVGLQANIENRDNPGLDLQQLSFILETLETMTIDVGLQWLRCEGLVRNRN